MDVDLLVIGGGVAGASAAITAAESGARVLLIEKLPRLGGSCIYPAGNLLELRGPEALEHLRSLAFSTTPDDVLTAYLGGCRPCATVDVDTAMLPRCWPDSAGAEGTIDRIHATAGVVLATAGVVLATGGFEKDPGLREAYLPVPRLHPVDNPGNTGDGLRAAQALGAALPRGDRPRAPRCHALGRRFPSPSAQPAKSSRLGRLRRRAARCWAAQPVSEPHRLLLEPRQFGGVRGHLTEHGGGLTDGLVFGAIAARDALGSR